MNKQNSRRKFVILLAVLMTAILLCACVLSACDERTGDKITVTFKVDNVTVKTVEIERNTKLSATDIPEDPQKEGYTFVEWQRLGDTPLNLDDRFIEDTVFVAVFDKNAVVVTFKNGNSVVHIKTFAPDGGTLQAADIPADPQGNGTFSGWWSGSVRAVAGLSITQDTVFEARFVTANVFEGYWADLEKHALISIADGVLSMPSADVDPTRDNSPLPGETLTENKVFTKGGTVMCSAVAGQFVAADEEAASFRAYIVSCDGGDNATLDVVTDASQIPGVFTPRTEHYTLKRCKEGDFPAGKYAVDDATYFDIASTGVITDIDGNGASMRYGFVYPVEGGYSIEYFIGNDTLMITKNSAEIDEKGNLSVKKDSKTEIYVKDYGRVDCYYSANGDELRCYWMENAPRMYVFFEVNALRGDRAYYATVQGNVTANSAFTLSYAGMARSASLDASGILQLGSKEVGTYSGDEGTLVLSGNGEGTLNGGNIAYAFNEYYNYVYIDGGVYALNYENGTYAAVTTADEFEGLTYTYTYNAAAGGYVSVTFDGYGRTTALLFVNDVETNDGAGMYYFGDGVALITAGLPNDIRDGVYDVLDDGDLLVYKSNRKFELIKQGVDYSVDVNSILGYWTNSDGDYVRIYFEDVYNAYKVDLSDYNGSDYSVTLTLSGALVNDDFDLYAKVTGGVLYVEYNGTTKAYPTHTANAPITIDDRFIGVWAQGDGTEYIIGENSLRVGGVDVDMATVEAYEIGGFVGYKFPLNGTHYVLVTDVYDQVWTWEFEHQLYNERGVYKKNATVTVDDVFIDAFEGTARLGDEDNGYNDFEMKINVTEHAIVFNDVNVQYFSCAYSLTSGYYQIAMYVNVLGTPMDVKMFYGETEGYSVRFTRIHAYNADDTVLSGTLRAFFNVWQHDDYIIEMDGKGNVTFSKDGGATSVTTRYTVTDGVAKFTAYDTEARVSLASEGMLSVTYGTQTFTAEIMRDPFKGLWRGTLEGGSSMYTFEFDGKGKVTIWELVPETGQPQSPDEEAVETTYHVSRDSSGRYVAKFIYDYSEIEFTMTGDNTATAYDGLTFYGDTFTRE